MNNKNTNDAPSLKSTASLSRRDLIKTLLGTASVSGAAATTGCGGDSSDIKISQPGREPSEPETTPPPTGNEPNPDTGPEVTPFRIDVHAHMLPDFYRDSLSANDVSHISGLPIPDWTPEQAIGFMDRFAIAQQIVSLPETGVFHLSTAQERLDMATQANNYLAQTLVPSGRFGGFAVLPLADPNDPVELGNASAEAQRAIEELGLSGVCLYTNYNGVYLGDPTLSPLLRTLNQLSAMVFVHPANPARPTPAITPDFIIENPFDTTRAAVNMLYKGVYKLFPRVRWLLAGAGGVLPFLSYRTSLFTITPVLEDTLNLGLVGDIEPLGSYKNLFYDTALSTSPASIRSLRTLVSIDNIMLGTDWPFSKPLFASLNGADPQPGLDHSFKTFERNNVDQANARTQLGLDK